jgi:hypothetical protein
MDSAFTARVRAPARWRIFDAQGRPGMTAKLAPVGFRQNDDFGKRQTASHVQSIVEIVILFSLLLLGKISPGFADRLRA